VPECRSFGIFPPGSASGSHWGLLAAQRAGSPALLIGPRLTITGQRDGVTVGSRFNLARLDAIGRRRHWWIGFTHGRDGDLRRLTPAEHLPARWRSFRGPIADDRSVLPRGGDRCRFRRDRDLASRRGAQESTRAIGSKPRRHPHGPSYGRRRLRAVVGLVALIVAESVTDPAYGIVAVGPAVAGALIGLVLVVRHWRASDRGVSAIVVSSILGIAFMGIVVALLASYIVE
jgi:hypothetical protein